jgi:hypothetical protein
VLARELASLEEQYRNLVDAVSSGVMTMDEAVHTLDNLVATDAEGTVWRLDLEGRFLAGRPGEQPQPADPQRFSVRTPGPWDGGWSAGIESAPSLIPSTPVESPSTPRRTVRKGARRPRVDVTSLLNRFGGFSRLRTPLIVVGALVAGLLVWTGSGSEDPQGTPLPVTESTVTPTTPLPGTPQEPVTPGDQDLTNTVRRLLASLGDPAVDLTSVIKEPGSGDKLLLRRAQYAGYRAVGLELAVVSVEEGSPRAVARIELRDGEGRAVVSGKVSVLREGDKVRLGGWPELGR